MIGQLFRQIRDRNRAFSGLHGKPTPHPNPRWTLDLIKEPPPKIFFVKVGPYLARNDHLTVFFINPRKGMWRVGRIPWLKVVRIAGLYPVGRPLVCGGFYE